MNDRMIPLTDHRGDVLVLDDDLIEPMPGSIVLTQGVWGTAWQRHFSDGKWHSTRDGAPKTWAEVLDGNNVVLVYDAPERPVFRKGDC